MMSQWTTAIAAAVMARRRAERATPAPSAERATPTGDRPMTTGEKHAARLRSPS